MENLDLLNGLIQYIESNIRSFKSKGSYYCNFQFYQKDGVTKEVIDDLVSHFAKENYDVSSDENHDDLSFNLSIHWK